MALRLAISAAALLLSSTLHAATYNIIGSLDNLGDFGESIYLSGNYLYMARNNVTRIIDVSTPSSPTLVGSYAHAGKAGQDVRVSGNYMYVVFNDSATLDTVDISNKASPARVNTLDMHLGGGAVELVGNALYVIYGTVVTSDTFRYYSLNVASGPALVAGSTTPMFGIPTSIYCAGTRCVVGHENTGTTAWKYLDVSTPLSPVDLSGAVTTTTPSEPRGVTICGGYAYAGSYFETTGAYGMDLSDETEPRWVSNISMPNPTWVTKTNASCTQLYLGMTDFFGTGDVFRMINLTGNGGMRQTSVENIHLLTNVMGLAVAADDTLFLGGRHTGYSLRVLRINNTSTGGKRSKGKSKQK